MGGLELMARLGEVTKGGMDSLTLLRCEDGHEARQRLIANNATVE
jgi:hypothetical protein